MALVGSFHAPAELAGCDKNTVIQGEGSSSNCSGVSPHFGKTLPSSAS
jgi:hypothetical protein